MLTLLKCETCGASDFDKHKSIDEYLVCQNCGNQYMTEVRNIQSYNLPIDLKVAVVGNHSKLTINNCIIKGNHNKINGDYNIILGNHNKIKGQNNICKGNHNKNITI